MADKFNPTPEQIEQAESLGGYLTEIQMAKFFKITHGEWKAACKRNPDLMNAYEKGASEVVGSVGRRLVQKALGGNVACMIFYMKAKGGWREAQRIEHTGAEGGPIQTEAIETARRNVLGRLAGISSRLEEGGGVKEPSRN